MQVLTRSGVCIVCVLRYLKLFSSATKRYRIGKTHKALLPKLKLASSFRDAGKTHRMCEVWTRGEQVAVEKGRIRM